MSEHDSSKAKVLRKIAELEGQAQAGGPPFVEALHAWLEEEMARRKAAACGDAAAAPEAAAATSLPAAEVNVKPPAQSSTKAEAEARAEAWIAAMLAAPRLVFAISRDGEVTVLEEGL